MAQILLVTTWTYYSTGTIPYNNFTKIGYDASEEILKWFVWIFSLTSATIAYPIFTATTVIFGGLLWIPIIPSMITYFGSSRLLQIVILTLYRGHHSIHNALYFVNISTQDFYYQHIITTSYLWVSICCIFTQCSSSGIKWRLTPWRISPNALNTSIYLQHYLGISYWNVTTSSHRKDLFSNASYLEQ